ncbi:flagellar hook-associated protein [Edwardsiella piscicida]|uniref:Flagellar hook-associated protein n=2 Tax=Edwardsiella piscicida TaxID=1263550 RepID=A0AAU8P2K3_EDWPI|nr:flagellar hook-associated protein FlgL [Edwardsiella piscicida]ACY84078.1 flagellar hook-associated protein [Edwardsiella tarda EIB202]MDM3865717.1 flagellar hook-associated protein FlgL [Edwardsiella piscicida]QHR96728.1 flagellar hook-filament junction protein FlgL [Edwardsiella piscicida]UJT83648.1 flagellar hook-associated protein FlgL [Edwardsiella piscicida]UJT86920.1 flagellar hook-associated protein FlgL [Edwardsiella piscicida]
MRLSTSMIYQQNMNGVLDAQSEWQRIGAQLDSGKKVINPSDDPLGSSQLVGLNQAKSMNEQYGMARGYARQSTSMEESVLQQVTNVLQNATPVLVDGMSSGTKSDDDRAAIATQLESMRDQLLNLANSTDGNGRYIFAGYKSDAAPFTKGAASEVTYGGGNKALTQQVDAARTMTVSHTGNQVFQPGTGEQDIFASLQQAIDALKMPLEGKDDAAKKAVADKLDSANRGLRNSLNNVSRVRAELGTQLNELDSLDAIGDENAITYKTRISSVQDVDWNQAITDYTFRQVSLQASYKVFSDMQGMSLFQMMR